MASAERGSEIEGLTTSNSEVSCETSSGKSSQKVSDPAIFEESGSDKARNATFWSKLLLNLENFLLTTSTPLLILIKNTIIFLAFLELDKFVLWRVTMALSDGDKNSIIGLVLQAVTDFSAIIIGLAYVVRLTVELIRNRDEFLGLPRTKEKK